MFKQTILIFGITMGLSMTTAADCYAQRRPKPAPKTKIQNPKLPKTAHKKAVSQFRVIRNNLASQRKFAAQTHASAQRSLQRSRETERALKDIHAGAMTAALKRVPSQLPEGVSRMDYARKDGAVRDAVKKLQTATTRRANAEATVVQTRAGLREANRQVKAANRTLSLAKKGDWVNAHRVVGRAKPLQPATRPRKITYNFTPLGPTPNGSNTPRRGILKTSPRKE